MTTVVELSAGTIRRSSVVCQVAFVKSFTLEGALRGKILVVAMADETEANTVASTGADVSDAVASGVGRWESYRNGPAVYEVSHLARRPWVLQGAAV